MWQTGEHPRGEENRNKISGTKPQVSEFEDHGELCGGRQCGEDRNMTVVLTLHKFHKQELWVLFSFGKILQYLHYNKKKYKCELTFYKSHSQTFRILAFLFFFENGQYRRMGWRETERTKLWYADHPRTFRTCYSKQDKEKSCPLKYFKDPSYHAAVSWGISIT